MSIKVREVLEEELPVIRVDRTFDLSWQELWSWVTDPERTAQWIGPWRRLDEERIEITWNREEGSPVETARLLELNENHGYTLQLNELDDSWLVLVSVTAKGKRQAVFTLIQPLADPEQTEAIQAGWEYYSDCLDAAISQTEFPNFSDYWTPSED